MSFEGSTLAGAMIRTQKNLKLIRELRDQRLAEGVLVDEDGPFEVTQLVNSFLAAFAHPWELLFKGRSVEQLPELSVLESHLAGAERMCPPGLDLVKRLGNIRNAFAHGNVEFLSRTSFRASSREITSVRLWNCPRSGVKNWEAEFTVDRLSDLLDDFMTITIKLYDPDKPLRDKDCPCDPD
jgi:hypothetical protein